jgi:hypothetical protein
MERKTGLREVIWGAKRPKFTASNGVWDDKGIAPKQVNVTLMNEGGKTADICFINGVALLSKFRECGIHIDGIGCFSPKVPNVSQRCSQVVDG